MAGRLVIAGGGLAARRPHRNGGRPVAHSNLTLSRRSAGRPVLHVAGNGPNSRSKPLVLEVAR